MSRPTSQQQLPNLEKLFKDDDDQDFAPLAGSNLAAIFGTPQKLGDVQTPLKQQPLQNTKPTSGRSTPQTVVQPASKTEVIIAKVVHAYKLVNGQYSLVGKLGVALTGNSSARVYQLILYRGKQEHVSTVTLSPEFAYTIRENNYATYYDASAENWSLRFDDEASCVELAREIGISRFHSAQHQQQPATRTDVFHQDLSILAGGRGSSIDRNDAEAGENDEIRLRCCISANLTQPLKFDATPGQDMRVRISRYDNWERFLLNCAKGLRRLMILPPSKQISLGPGFPKERDIAMEIEIVEVIKNNEDTPSSSPVANKPLLPGGKASILSRMAKMGQSMLPKVPLSATTDSEDTEEELRVKSPRRFKPEVSAVHASKHQSRGCPEVHQEPAPVNVLVARSGSAVSASSSLPLLAHRPMQNSPSFASPCWPLTPIQQQQHQQYVAMDGQYYPIHPQPAIAQSLPVAMDPNVSVFLSETRTQNTELRMGMTKIADNVQKLLDKFHVLEVQNASSPMILQRPFRHCHTEDPGIHRDAESFYSGEGENGAAVNAKNYYSAAENEPGAEFHRAKDPSERERRLEIELNRARESLDRRDAECARLEAEKREWSNDRSELEGRLERLEEALLREKTALGVSNEALAQLRDKNSLLESSITNITAEKLSSGNEGSINQKTADIKRLMNNTYRSLLAQFSGHESYEADHIKNTLADIIRKITFSVLNDLQRDETEDENSESVSESVSIAGGTEVAAGAQELDAFAGTVGRTENDSVPLRFREY